MTTLAQIKRLAAPLLSRNADLALIGKWIVVKPIHHVAAALLIDRTGEAARFRPTWAVTDVVGPLGYFSINWGRRIAHPTRRLWFWDDPTISQALIEVMEGEVLPRLRALRRLDEFVAFTCDRNRFPSDPLDAFLLRYLPVQAARGEFASARAICTQLATGKTQWSGEWYKPWMAHMMDDLKPLIEAEDRAGIGRLLHDWEAGTIKRIGFESAWEATSFPVELAS